jgi:nitrate reductase delta subunit
VSLWSDPAASPSPLGRARRAPEHLAAVERLKDWTRSRFVLTGEDTIVVTEVSRDLPGWPEQETVVGFWTADGTRHHFRVFKRVEDVVEDDLPPPWLKASLAASEGIQCACC